MDVEIFVSCPETTAIGDFIMVDDNFHLIQSLNPKYTLKILIKDDETMEDHFGSSSDIKQAKQFFKDNYGPNSTYIPEGNNDPMNLPDLSNLKKMTKQQQHHLSSIPKGIGAHS